MVAQVVRYSRTTEIKKRRNLRRICMAHQKNLCFVCMNVMNDPTTGKPSEPYTATFEHIRPYSMMGLTHEDNCVATCAMCNGLRGTLDLNVFKEIINKFEKYELNFRNIKKYRKIIKKYIHNN